MAFQFEKTKLDGVYLVKPQVFGDSRGYFMETYKKTDFLNAGIDVEFVQDNESRSTKGVLRGLHFQKAHTQGKLVRVTKGMVYDVAVDVRPDSGTFGQWVGVTLSADEKVMLYIAEGFAHGFLVLSDEAEFIYKCTDVYDPSSEGGIMWNDPALKINWPELDVDYRISEKDGKHPGFTEQSFSWAEGYSRREQV